MAEWKNERTKERERCKDLLTNVVICFKISLPLFDHFSRTKKITESKYNRKFCRLKVHDNLGKGGCTYFLLCYCNSSLK